MSAIMSHETSERRELLLTMIRSGRSDLRDRALRTGAETLPEAAIVELLRDEADDVARNSGLDMLKLRGRRSFSIAVALLTDHDPDVALQAVLLLDAIGDPRAWPHLRPLLRHSDENVVQAAIIAAGRLGSASAVADVLPFLAGDPWVQAAALTALGQLRSRDAVPAIAPLLGDPLLGELAAESLARIGGTMAATALVQHWGDLEERLDATQWMPLVAQVLCEADAPVLQDGLRKQLGQHVASNDPELALAAARALLASGPGDDDGAALELVLNAESRNADDQDSALPACLARRYDLAQYLLCSGVARNWGYELYRRDPRCIEREVVQRVIVEFPPTDAELLGTLVARIDDTPTLIALYLGEPLTRDAIAPLLRARAGQVCEWLDATPELDGTSRLLLLDGASAELRELRKGVCKLDIVERVSLVGELRSPSVLLGLPWLLWIEEDRDTFARLLGEVTARRHLDGLMPLVRRQIVRDALPELVACAGAMRDRESLPLLIRALHEADPSLRHVLFDAIAAIGGESARNVLYPLATCGEPEVERLAAIAIAQHATPQDCAMLRTLAASTDWAIRYQAAGALGQFPQPENVETLAVLAADPTAVVAQRARGWLNAMGGAA